ERHVPLAAHPQLPVVRVRPGRLQHRHLGPAGRPGLARARAVRQLRGRARHHHRPAVPAGAGLRPVRRGPRRPLRQAPAADRRAGRHGPARPGAGTARPVRRGAAVARLRAGLRPRPGLGRRHPGPAGVRLRDGRPRRPAQRRQPQQRDVQLRPRRRTGRRRHRDRRGRHGLGLPRQRPELPGRAGRPAGHARRRAALHRARRAGQGPAPGGTGVRAVAAGPARAHRARLRGRHLRAELPAHAGAGRQGGLRAQRRGVRPAVVLPGRRVAARRAGQRPADRAAPAAHAVRRRPRLRPARGGGRPGADLRADGGAARPDGRGGADLHHDRERHRAAGQRGAGARARHGAVRPGLPRRHADRGAAGGRARRGVRPAQQHRAGRCRHRGVRRRGRGRHDPGAPAAAGAPPRTAPSARPRPAAPARGAGRGRASRRAAV
ncbi:MAG: Uncharacterized MFS-type transporter, partial [uncultured Frankineae bacterium]